jgi:hypothetical protein
MFFISHSYIDSEILQALMSEYDVKELEATDIYYTSATYAQLSDETTALYQQPWTEIYTMLKQELSSIQ